MFRHHNPQLTSGNSTRGKINQKPEDQPQDQELFSPSQSVQVDQTLTVNPEPFLQVGRRIYYSRTPLFQTRLIRSPHYFTGRPISLGFTLPLYASPVISKPRYFELFSISLGTSKQQGSTVVYQTSRYKTLAEQQDSHTLESKYN